MHYNTYRIHHGHLGKSILQLRLTKVGEHPIRRQIRLIHNAEVVICKEQSHRLWEGQLLDGLLVLQGKSHLILCLLQGNAWVRLLFLNIQVFAKIVCSEGSNALGVLRRLDLTRCKDYLPQERQNQQQQGQSHCTESDIYGSDNSTESYLFSLSFFWFKTISTCRSVEPSGGGVALDTMWDPNPISIPIRVLMASRIHEKTLE